MIVELKDKVSNLTGNINYHIILLVLIRIIYTILCNLELADLWYEGYGSYGINFNFSKELLSLLSCVFVIMFYYKLTFKGKMLKSFMLLFMILYYIPLSATFSLNNASYGFWLLSTVFCLLVIFMTSKLSNIIPDNNLYSNKDNSEKLVSIRIFCFIMCILYILYKLSYNGLTLSVSIESDTVYSNRAIYQQYLDGMSGSLFAYFLSILRNSISYIAPFYLFISMLNKKYLGVFISLLTILSIFSVSSGKSTLIFLFVVLVLYLLQRIQLDQYFDDIVIVGMLMFLLFCLVEFVFSDSRPLFMLLIRREMYLPAWLNQLYYNYFSTHDKVWFTDSAFILQTILPDRLNDTPVSLISNAFFQGEIPSPNTGLFAEAYMQAGILGVIGFPVLIGLMLVVMNLIYKNFNFSVQLLIVIKLILQITNVPVLRTDFMLSFVLFSVIIFILQKINLCKIKKEYVLWI